MVALDFLLNGRYRPTVINFNHGTEFGEEAWHFVYKKCNELGLSTVSTEICFDPPKGQSIEEFWRNERYRFFNSLGGPVITAHHLDDATEWWLFTSLHGTSRLIPYSRGKVIRPFLLTSKSDILSWAERRGVEYLDDPANSDEKYMRSIVRHKIMPEALRVNPGLRTVIKKKYELEYGLYPLFSDGEAYGESKDLRTD